MAEEDFCKAISDEASRIAEDSEHSSKGHFEAARLWENVHLWIGIPTTILAAAAGASALTSYKFLAAGLSLLVAISAGVTTFLKPDGRASRHLQAGNSYKSLQNNARIFKEIECASGAAPKQLTANLMQLSARRNKLNEESPQIPRYAFRAAKAGIDRGEAKYRIDAQKSEG